MFPLSQIRPWSELYEEPLLRKCWWREKKGYGHDLSHVVWRDYRIEKQSTFGHIFKWPFSPAKNKVVTRKSGRTGMVLWISSVMPQTFSWIIILLLWEIDVTKSTKETQVSCYIKDCTGFFLTRAEPSWKALQEFCRDLTCQSHCESVYENVDDTLLYITTAKIVDHCNSGKCRRNTF